MKNNLVQEKEIGHIFSSFSGVVKIVGLPHVFLHEILVDENSKPQAIVVGFDEEFVDALLFDKLFESSKPLFRSKQIFSISITQKILSRVLNGLGQPRDGLAEIHGEKFPVFKLAPPIIDREPVDTPLSTGIKVIDATLPIGRGQRELIIGDRKLGKTTLGVDTVLNQKKADPPVFCIYVLCGKKQRELDRIVEIFRYFGAFSYSLIVASLASDSLAQKYLAPFVGMTIGEYFRDRGLDALIVIDDLTKHAKVWRDISLLLERPPGRESYPGDIFSLHARLLERAAKLSKKKGQGSLTALPIIETEEGDIASFIPTNLISITDGQIYLERGLFDKGFIPAVNIGLSVSRVGAKAQPRALKEVTSGLRLSLSQQKELQKLVQLETKVSQEAQKKIRRGDLILEALKQEKHKVLGWEEEVVLFFGLENGYFDEIDLEKWQEFEARFIDFFNNYHSDLLQEIKRGDFSDSIKKKLRKVIEEFVQHFSQ